MTRAVAIAPSQRPVVFVVDDDPSIRDALEDLLGSAGLEVQSFGSAQEFLRSKWPGAPGCLYRSDGCRES